MPSATTPLVAVDYHVMPTKNVKLIAQEARGQWMSKPSLIMPVLHAKNRRYNQRFV